MIAKSVLVVALVCLPSFVFAQNVNTKGPSYEGFGQSFDNVNFPGDEHGSIGRTYVVVHTNDDFGFLKRSSLLSVSQGNNPPPPAVVDASFWGSSLPAASVIMPGGTPPASGTVTINPNPLAFSDGRIYYDPYSPCGDGQGRWISVEMAQLTFPDNSVHASILVGVSQQEDPNPADSGVQWTKFALASTAPPTNGDEGFADFPRVGFNTNWIAISAEFFFNTTFDTPLLFFFPRQSTECSNTIPNNPTPMVGAGAGAGKCTGTAASGTPNAWYCNDTQLTLNCPSETYHTGGQDLDATALYLITSNDQTHAATAGSVSIFEVTGSTSSGPTYQGIVSTPNILSAPQVPIEATDWNPILAELINGTGLTRNQTITTGPFDDRFISCVVRNYGIWATQTVGLPGSPANPTQVATANAVQWWNIGVDAYLGTIYDFERIGGGQSNNYGNESNSAVSPSIAVNYNSDLLVAYEQIAAGAVSARYTEKHNSDCSESDYSTPTVAGTGASPYFPNGFNGAHPRTGDFSHGNVDPIDDKTFFETTGFSGTPLSSGGYGWEQFWSIVGAPSNPLFSRFASWTEGEAESSAHSGSQLTVTISPPSGVQAGDWLFATLWNSLSNAAISYPPGWTLLPMDDSTTQIAALKDDGCGNIALRGRILAHRYTGTGEPSSYSFTTGYGSATCGNTTYTTENGANIFAYRSTCKRLFDPAGLSLYHLFGHGVGFASTTMQLNSATPGDNQELLNIVDPGGEGEPNEQGEGTVCAGLTTYSGSPALSFVEGLSDPNCPDNQEFMADGQVGPTSHSTTYGPYEFTQYTKGWFMGWQLLLDPY